MQKGFILQVCVFQAKNLPLTRIDAETYYIHLEVEIGDSFDKAVSQFAKKKEWWQEVRWNAIFYLPVKDPSKQNLCIRTYGASFSSKIFELCISIPLVELKPWEDLRQWFSSDRGDGEIELLLLLKPVDTSKMLQELKDKIEFLQRQLDQSQTSQFHIKKLDDQIKVLHMRNQQLDETLKHNEIQMKDCINNLELQHNQKMDRLIADIQEEKRKHMEEITHLNDQLERAKSSKQTENNLPPWDFETPGEDIPPLDEFEMTTLHQAEDVVE